MQIQIYPVGECRFNFRHDKASPFVHMTLSKISSSYFCLQALRNILQGGGNNRDVPYGWGIFLCSVQVSNSRIKLQCHNIYTYLLCERKGEPGK